MSVGYQFCFAHSCDIFSVCLFLYYCESKVGLIYFPSVIWDNWKHLDSFLSQLRVSSSTFMNMQSPLTLLLDLLPPSPPGFQDIISIQELLRVLHNSPHLSGIQNQPAHPTQAGCLPNQGPWDSEGSWQRLLVWCQQKSWIDALQLKSDNIHLTMLLSLMLLT